MGRKQIFSNEVKRAKIRVSSRGCEIAAPCRFESAVIVPIAKAYLPFRPFEYEVDGDYRVYLVIFDSGLKDEEIKSMPPMIVSVYPAMKKKYFKLDPPSIFLEEVPAKLPKDAGKVIELYEYVRDLAGEVGALGGDLRVTDAGIQAYLIVCNEEEGEDRSMLEKRLRYCNNKAYEVARKLKQKKVKFKLIEGKITEREEWVEWEPEEGPEL